MTSVVGMIGPMFLGSPAPSSLPCELLESTVAVAASLTSGGSGAALSTTVLNLFHGARTTMIMTKLKLIAAGLLLVGLAGTGAAVLARQDAPKSVPQAANERVAEITVSDGEILKNALVQVHRGPGGKDPEGTAHELDLPDPHEIVVPPGANVLIRIETKDGNLIHCAATVQGDGRLHFKENLLNRATGGRIETAAVNTGILISPTRSQSRVSDNSAPSSARKQDQAGLEEQHNATDHESRLLEVERKLDRVLKQLEHRYDPVLPTKPDEPSRPSK
jgi:hypothetical protein